MNNPEINGDWIDRYNDNDLDENERALFQSRMHDNPLLRSEVRIDACLKQFLEDEALLDLMAKVQAAAREKGHSGGWTNFILMAASILMLLMIGGLFLLMKTHEMAFTDTVGHQRPATHEQQKAKTGGAGHRFAEHHSFDKPDNPVLPVITPGMLAQNFVPLPEFELLTGVVTRSLQMKLISPVPDAICHKGNPVVFKWSRCKMTPDSVVIMNNRGKVVDVIRLENCSSCSLKTTSLSEGLYYWKVLESGNFIIMGRFYIVK